MGVSSLEVSHCKGMLPPEAQTNRRASCFDFFVIILVKVTNTRENLHVVLGAVYGGKKLSFLPTVSFPSQRQALFSALDVFFWR